MKQNLILVQQLSLMAKVLKLLDANKFKIAALEKGARVIESLVVPIDTLPDKELSAFPGIGKGLLESIGYFKTHGVVLGLDDALAEVPAGLLDVLALPGVGPSTARLLWHQCGVTDLVSLEEAIESGRCNGVKGLGPKKMKGLSQGIVYAKAHVGRMPVKAARPLAESYVEMFESVEWVHMCEIAGSLRRGAETVGDIDICIGVADTACASDVFDAFVAFVPMGVHQVDVLVRGDTKCSIKVWLGRRVIQIDCRVVSVDTFGATLNYFTGSQAHNVHLRELASQANLRLSEYGLFDQGGQCLAAQTESEIYASLGMSYIPAELREDSGEIDKALALGAQGDLQKELIGYTDLKAELHAHTRESDGVLSLHELVESARLRGCHTLGVTDHSKSQGQANGLSEERLLAQVKQIKSLQIDGLILLASNEVDILADGTLDYADDVLAELDYVLASPHAALHLEGQEATDRLIRAIEHPKVRVIGHPTGRLIGRRQGMQPDMRAVCEAAAEHQVALEINANPSRLDLSAEHAALAISMGCKLAINTDAHSAEGLHTVFYGIQTARRAGARASDVINTWSQEALLGFLCGPSVD